MSANRTIAGRTILLSLLFVLLLPVTRAQVRQVTPLMDPLGTREKAAAATAMPAPAPALESTIDPDNYFVGPSDGFGVNVWIDPPVALRLTVTPEGTLIVPGVGEISVANMSLSAARTKILGEIKKRFRYGEASVTLVAPRSVVVSVQGRVLNPGSFVLPAYSRVDKAVEEANKILTGQTFDEPRWIRDLMSTRRILVRHHDGKQARVDLKKFLATKNDRWNPYLREGDIIVVPTNDFTRNAIGVYGYVNGPGKYEFSEGDSAKDALQIAYGFSPRAIQDSVEFIRQDENGQNKFIRIIDGAGILSGRVPDIALQPGDRLLVHGRADLRGDYTVTVRGQVRNPGVYPITRGSTRLTDVIRSAGGFTEDASLSSAELIRRSVAEGEIETERLQSIRGGVPPEDSSYYYLETRLRLRKEVVDVNFAALFIRGDSSQNVFVRDEDIIHVPTTTGSIYVFGQVVSPGHIQYVPGQGVSYYLDKAGGVTERARDSDIKIVKAKTRQWLSADEGIVEEGDYVWVPKVAEKPFGYYLAIVAQSAAILSAAIGVVLLGMQLK
jgi:protein involved in polysaccharide export with SLBB domain